MPFVMFFFAWLFFSVVVVFIAVVLRRMIMVRMRMRRMSRMVVAFLRDVLALITILPLATWYNYAKANSLRSETSLSMSFPCPRSPTDI